LDGAGNGEEDFACGKPSPSGVYWLGVMEDWECSSVPTTGARDEQGGDGKDLKARDCKTGEESDSVVDMVERS